MNKTQEQLTNAREQYVSQFGVEPKYAEVLARFNGNKNAENQVIRILDDDEQSADTDSFFDDDEIFFYVKNFDELITLCLPNNGEDFVVVDYIDLFDEL